MTPPTPKSNAIKLGSLILINLAVAFVWLALQPVAAPGEFILGFVVGFVLLAILHPAYGGQFFAIVGFFIWLAWSIIKSSVQVGGIILSPHLRLDEGIVAVPLEASTDLEISLLVTSLVLTPGSLAVEVETNADGQRVLYAHFLRLGDPEAARREIKDQFERRILRFTRAEALQ